MALFTQNLDFTTLDFDALRLKLIELARQVFPQWTDFNKASFGNILIEMLAFTGDIANGLADNHAIEGKVVTARLRKSMILLAKGFGFELPGAEAALVDLTFSIPAAIANDIIIAVKTIVRTEDVEPVVFQTLAVGTLLAGNTSVIISTEQSESKDDGPFTADGSSDQRFPLAFTPFLDNSAIVDVDGDAFTEVDNFLGSSGTDKNFVIEVDENDRGTLVFGDGVNGVAPTGTVNIEYKVGGGEVGNVEAGTIIRLDGTFFDVLNNQVALTVSNLIAAAGGIERMTVEEARIAIPDSVRATGKRSVTREDFEINARKTRGVARALMLTADEDTSIAENTGKLFIIPVGGGIPSGALKTLVKSDIDTNTPPCATFTFTVEDPGLKVINVTADVFLDAGATASVVKQAIEDALDAFFNPLNPDNTPNVDVDFGFNLRKNLSITNGEITFSDIFNVVRDVAGVRKIDEDAFVPADDTVILDSEFPVLGTVTLTNGDIGGPL